MVLKKSNSHLNSGATQHVMRGCFVGPSLALLQKFIEISVDIPSIEVTEEVDGCLGEINEYLGFSLPKFSNVSTRGWNRKSSISCDKGGNWQLKQKIDALMNDIDFLKKVSRTVDINFTEISKNLASARNRSSSTTKTSSQILKAFESEEQEREKARLLIEGTKSRKRQTYHARGVQRRYKSRSNKELERNDNQQEGESSEERKATLAFTFHKPCTVDARAGRLCEYKYPAHPGQKSLKKRKGFVNGFRSENRELSDNVLKDTKDLQFMDHRALKVDELSIAGIEFETGEEFPDPSYTSCLEDFIPTQKVIKRKHSLCNHKKDLLACKEASICDITDKPKHPKGSYICINPDSDNSLCDSSWEVIESSEYQSLLTNDWKNENQIDLVNNGVDMSILEDSQKTPNEVLNRPDMNSAQDAIQGQEKASKSFIESFISVQALMPGDGISLFPETLEKLHLDGRSNVTIGDSVPHCFCISPMNRLNKSYIVARRASRDGKTWLFSFQGSSTSQKESFRKKLSRLHQFEEQVSLIQVIKVGEEILNEDADSQELIGMDIDVRSCAKPTDSELDLWVELANRLWQKVSIHTAEEAAEKIRISLIQSKEPGTRSVCPKISEDIECGVCFSLCSLYGTSDGESAMMLMPCGHMYCVSCWRVHVYHSISSGAPRISCMTRGCDTILDETTIKTLVPSSMLASWQVRLRDRLLQSSKYTSWCPDGRCGHVAMSSGAPLKKQFGSPLICNCLRSWCSNCQEDPHWPVSCDQMSVYKKLLSKTGEESYLPVTHASYSIDVKKYPNCKYPIEKFQGCPSMVCRMCWFNFCWNCLQSTEKHNVYSCKVAPTAHSVTFQLNNQLVYDLPIKYFLESVQAHKQHVILRQKRCWLQNLRTTFEYKFSLHRRPSSRKLSRCSSDAGVNSTFQLIDEVLAFMKGAFTQIELFYVLLGFAQLNKTKTAVRLIACANSKISRLHFIVDRLSSHVFERSLSHISAINKQARLLLRAGMITLEEMFALAPQLQQVSKDVETAWVGNIDPSKHIRYM